MPLDRRLFVLEAEHHQEFAAVLADPPPPGPMLRALFRRKPAWTR